MVFFHHIFSKTILIDDFKRFLWFYITINSEKASTDGLVEKQKRLSSLVG